MKYIEDNPSLGVIVLGEGVEGAGRVVEGAGRVVGEDAAQVTGGGFQGLVSEALLQLGEGHAVAEAGDGEGVTQGHGGDGAVDSGGGGEFPDASFDTAGRERFGGVWAGENEVISEAEAMGDRR